MIWKILIFLAMAGVIVAGFLTPAPQQQIGEASRIFYFHVPQAWISVVAFAMSMVYSVRYLRSRAQGSPHMQFDDQAMISAGLGFVFCVLATLTGSMFGKVAWGSFWNWDPRETSIFVLLLIYAAYFALRNAVEDEEKRASLASVYAIFAFVTVPFLVFVLPRVTPSLHPEASIVDSNLEIQMTTPVATVFFSSLAVFTVLYVWIFSLARRTFRLVRAREEADLQ
jgi:heme exporter protein C